MKRVKMSKRGSRKDFSRKSAAHPLNAPRFVMRGGIRL